MIVITYFLFMVPVAFTLYWIGKAVMLNQVLKAEDNGTAAVHPDALVNLKTGEIIEPDTRKYARKGKAAGVKFQ